MGSPSRSQELADSKDEKLKLLEEENRKLKERLKGVSILSKSQKFSSQSSFSLLSSLFFVFCIFFIEVWCFLFFWLKCIDINIIIWFCCGW